jgi:hypothetical protein
MNEVFIVFQGSWGENDVVGVAEDESVARELAERTMDRTAVVWEPKKWDSIVACWKHGNEYVFVERYTVERRKAGES